MHTYYSFRRLQLCFTVHLSPCMYPYDTPIGMLDALSCSHFPETMDRTKRSGSDCEHWEKMDRIWNEMDATHNVPARKTDTDMTHVDDNKDSEPASTAQTQVLECDDLMCCIMTVWPTCSSSSSSFCQPRGCILYFLFCFICIQFVDMESKVRQLPLVNRTWNRACQSPASWHSICVSRWQIRLTAIVDYNNAISHLAPRLSRLEVVWRTDMTLSDDVFTSMISVCGPRLRTLRMKFTDDQLMAAALGAPRLQCIHVQTVVSAHGLASALPFLRQLKAIHVAAPSLMRELYDINSCCPFLETYCGYVDERVLAILSSCATLTELNGSGRHDDDGDLFHICTHDVTNAMAGFLASVGSNLISIDFPHCDGTVVLPLVAQHCKKIMKLYMYRVSRITDALMEEVVCNCGSTLEEIDLRMECTDASLVSVAAHCPNITTVCLSYNSNVTNDGLAVLTASCPRLRCLYLNSTDLLDDSLLALAEIPSVRHVEVSVLVTAHGIKTAHARRAELGLPGMVTKRGAVSVYTYATT
jgi:hypothetical protein